MAHADLVDSLVATYRKLNMTVRPLGSDVLSRPGSNGTSLRDVILEMRNSELIASQQLKYMSLGDAAPPSSEIAAVTAVPSVDENNARVLLSEFGTAREAILALVRELSDDDWNRQVDGPKGKTSILQFVQDIVAADQRRMNEIEGMVPARA